MYNNSKNIFLFYFWLLFLASFFFLWKSSYKEAAAAAKLYGGQFNFRTTFVLPFFSFLCGFLFLIDALIKQVWFALVAFALVHFKFITCLLFSPLLQWTIKSDGVFFRKVSVQPSPAAPSTSTSSSAEELLLFWPKIQEEEENGQILIDWKEMRTAAAAAEILGNKKVGSLYFIFFCLGFVVVVVPFPFLFSFYLMMKFLAAQFSHESCMNGNGSGGGGSFYKVQYIFRN